MSGRLQPDVGFVPTLAKKRGLSRKQMADGLGYSTPEYRHLRQGAPISLATADRLAELLDVPLGLIIPSVAVPFIEPRSVHWVYRCLDIDGDAIYVGCTGNLRQRLYTHRKTSPWAESVARVKATVHPYRSEALKVELAEIRRLDPPCNVHGRLRLVKEEAAA